MNILAAITRKEKKVKKQLAKLQHDLIALQSAAKPLGKSANRDLTTAKKRVLSAARTMATPMSLMEQIYGGLMRTMGFGDLFGSRTEWRGQPFEVAIYGYSS